MPTPTSFKALVDGLLGLVNLIIPAIMAVVFVVLAWKIFDAWVVHADDEKKQSDGKQIALTAVLVFVVLIAVWGIVFMIRQSIFG
jgi:hypothetical protein